MALSGQGPAAPGPATGWVMTGPIAAAAVRGLWAYQFNSGWQGFVMRLTSAATDPGRSSIATLSALGVTGMALILCQTRS